MILLQWHTGLTCTRKGKKGRPTYSKPIQDKQNNNNKKDTQTKQKQTKEREREKEGAGGHFFSLFCLWGRGAERKEEIILLVSSFFNL